MLFKGEAIFGVVDFSQQSRAACRASQIVEQAKKLGVSVRLRSTGAAMLGIVGNHRILENSHSINDTAEICAISCGELIDRKGSKTLYLCEPDRSAFLATGIRAEGLPFLQHIDGTFAAAIWCPTEELLTLACDWRGDGRLYYSYSVERDQMAFSSWLPLLKTQSLEIDREAVAEFLRFLYIAPPRTVYRGIDGVEAGCYLTASRGGIRTHRCVFQPAQDACLSTPNDADQTLTDFQRRFETAIQRRIGQRRVGVLLSSGVDSAVLVAGCQSVNPGCVDAFTVGFDDIELDETRAAAALAHQIGVPHRELRFAPSDYAAAFERVAKNMEQPFGDPAQLPLSLACTQAKEFVDVLCDGTGSDGLFGSPVPRHLRFSLEMAAKLPATVRLKTAAAMRKLNLLNVSQYAALFDFDDPEELLITWSGWRRGELSELLGRPVEFSQSAFYRCFRAHADSSAQALFDAIGVFPPDDSRFDAAALAQIPLELPYHDIDLWRYVRELPGQYRIADGETKVILRRLFCHYFPSAGPASKKHYFNIPLQEVMARSNFSLINEYLTQSKLKNHGLVDPEVARRWIERYIAGDQSLLFKVWALLVAHAWLESRN